MRWSQKWRNALSIFLLLAIQVQVTTATFWTVTTWFVESSTTSTFTNCGGPGKFCTLTDTVERTVAPDATPSAGASTISTTSFDLTHIDVTVIYIWLEHGSVPDSDLLPEEDPFGDSSSITSSTSDPASNVYTKYQMPVVYTAPASCPTPFTYATYTRIDPPEEVTHLPAFVSALSTSTSITTISYNGAVWTETYLNKYVESSAAPVTLTTLNELWSMSIARCFNPASASTTEDPRLHSSDEYWRNCGDVEEGCASFVQAWVIAIAVVIPLLFLFGFAESYFWFRKLMLGGTALRLGTISWCLLFPIVMPFLTRVSPARPDPQERALMKQYWAALGAGQRLKLWMKWGFKHQYPIQMLDADPRIYGKSGGIGYQGQPPPASRGVVVAGTRSGGGGAGHPQQVVAVQNGNGYSVPSMQQQGIPVYMMAVPGRVNEKTVAESTNVVTSNNAVFTPEQQQPSNWPQHQPIPNQQQVFYPAPVPVQTGFGGNFAIPEGYVLVPQAQAQGYAATPVVPLVPTHQPSNIGVAPSAQGQQVFNGAVPPSPAGSGWHGGQAHSVSTPSDLSTPTPPPVGQESR